MTLKKYLDEKLCNNNELTDDIDRELIKNLDFKNLKKEEIRYLEQVDEILVGEEDKKLEKGESINRPILEPIVEPSNVESYLDKWVFKAKTKLENWKTIPQARDLLVLELEDHKPSQWKQVFN